MVPVNHIPGPAHEVRRRLLGTDCANVFQVVNEVGNQRSVKLRLRGQGSGFREDGQHELMEPMHFNVCAESPELLDRALERLNVLVQTVYHEFASGQPHAGHAGAAAGDAAGAYRR